MKIIYEIGYYGYLLILSLNLILYSRKIKKEEHISWKIITAYIWTMFAVQIISDIVAYFVADSSYFLHIYLGSHFILISTFYYSVIPKNRQKRFVKITALGVCAFLVLQYFIHPTLWFQFNLSEIFLVNYLLTLYSLMYSYSSLSEKIRFPYFNIGIITYSMLSLASFLYGNIASKMELAISIPVWVIHITVLIFFQCMILTQWIKHFHKKREKWTIRLKT